MKRSIVRKIGCIAAAFAAVVVLSACQNDQPKISISGAKAELSPAIIGEAMVTMNIRNDGGTDVIRGVKTDIAGATASVHAMEGERMVTMDMMEVMGKSTQEFKMGGSHIMIQGMPKSVKEGSKFNLTLVFQKSGEMTVPLVLQGPPAMPMEHGHTM